MTDENQRTPSDSEWTPPASELDTPPAVLSGTGAAGQASATAPSPREPARGARTRRATSSSGTGAVVPLLVALIVTLVVQQLLNSTVPADSYFYRLFRPAGGWIMGLVPGLIGFVFVWTLTDLVLKLRVAPVNEGDLDSPEVGKLPWR